MLVLPSVDSEISSVVSESVHSPSVHLNVVLESALMISIILSCGVLVLWYRDNMLPLDFCRPSQQCGSQLSASVAMEVVMLLIQYLK